MKTKIYSPIKLSLFLSLLLAFSVNVRYANAQAPSNGLVAYIPFENNTFSAKVGLYSGVPTGNPTFTQGVKGTAVSFNAEGQYVNYPSLITPAMTQWTVAMWYRRDADGASNVYVEGPFNQADNSPNGVTRPALTYASNSLNRKGFYGDDANVTIVDMRVDTPSVQGQWYHVAWTYDGATFREYVNGSENYSLSLMGLLMGNNYPFQVGRGVGYSTATSVIYGQHIGPVDEIFVYNRALSATEVVSVTKDTSVSTAVGPTTMSSNLRTWPNPSNGAFRTEWTGEAASLEIVNALGEVVYRQAVPQGKTTEDLQPGLVSGLYVLRLSGGQTLQTQKLIIAK